MILSCFKVSVMLKSWICFFLSLQALHKKLLNVDTCQGGGRAEQFFKDRYWHGDNEIVHAVWKLVHVCGSDDTSEVRELVSDFISRVLVLLVFDFITFRLCWTDRQEIHLLLLSLSLSSHFSLTCLCQDPIACLTSSPLLPAFLIYFLMVKFSWWEGELLTPGSHITMGKARPLLIFYPREWSHCT